MCLQPLMLLDAVFGTYGTLWARASSLTLWHEVVQSGDHAHHVPLGACGIFKVRLFSSGSQGLCPSSSKPPLSGLLGATPGAAPRAHPCICPRPGSFTSASTFVLTLSWRFASGDSASSSRAPSRSASRVNAWPCFLAAFCTCALPYHTTKWTTSHVDLVTILVVYVVAFKLKAIKVDLRCVLLCVIRDSVASGFYKGSAILTQRYIIVCMYFGQKPKPFPQSPHCIATPINVPCGMPIKS
jgi:hypothetical protein